MRRVWSFVEDESGATAIEYSLIAAGIALVIVAAVNGIGTILNTTFTACKPRASRSPPTTVPVRTCCALRQSPWRPSRLSIP